MYKESINTLIQQIKIIEKDKKIILSAQQPKLLKNAQLAETEQDIQQLTLKLQMLYQDLLKQINKTDAKDNKADCIQIMPLIKLIMLR